MARDHGAAGVSAPEWIVGIGSSAGGIEALRELLPSLGHGPVCYVVAQHMSPEHPSLLLQVLARESPLRMVEASDGTVLCADMVYLCPPNNDVSVRDGVLHIAKASPRISPQPSVDVLFESIADAVGARGIGIVLSGTGSDGRDGAFKISQADGIVIAQDPTTARYRDMPDAVIDSGLAAFVRSPAEIGPLVIALLEKRESGKRPSRWADGSAMAVIAREARRVTGWDLASYKSGTVNRQLDKRIQSLHLANREEYAEYVTSHPAELADLRDSILINVTAFFRDRRAFDALAAELATLVLERGGDHPLRAWVPACATGEEAYSVAVLLLEAARAAGHTGDVKVFATDISETALDRARQGVYGLAALADVSRDLAARYFSIEDGVAVADKRLRQTLVVARHDVTRDPPMVRMDLISCRNLLIYLVPEVQARVLAGFHTALNPSGLLFLGKSENISGEAPEFESVSAGNRLFRKTGFHVPGRLAAPVGARAVPGDRWVPARPPRRDEIRDRVRDQLLADFGPPSVVIDRDGVLIQQVGSVTRYLDLPAADSDFSIVSMIVPSLRTEVSTLLSRLNTLGRSVVDLPVLARQADGSAMSLTLSMRSLDGGRRGDPLYVLSFVEGDDGFGGPLSLSEAESGDEGLSGSHPARPISSDEELAMTRRHLTAVVEELESSNEELQTMNEELQSSTEELVATNEELQTTNEELQSTNEELTTVNETLQVRSVELTEANIMLESIQSAVNSAVVVVDAKQRVTRYSPLAVKLFGLTRSDLGANLNSLPAHFDLPALARLVGEVITNDEDATIEVQTTTATFLLKIAPFRESGRPAGAVLAFTDVSELAEARRTLAQQNEEFRILAQAVPYAVYRSSVDRSSLLYLSATARELFNLRVADAAEVSLADFIHADDRARVSAIWAAGQRDAVVDYRIVVAGGANRIVRDISHVDQSDSGASRVGALIDITDLVKARLDSEALAAIAIDEWRGQLDAVFAGAGAPMAILSDTGRLTRANRALGRLLGQDPVDLVGRHLDDITLSEDVAIDQVLFNQVLRGERADYSIDKRFIDRDGRVILGRQTVSVGSLDANNPLLILSIVDLTEDRQREVSALQSAQVDPLTGLSNRVLLFDRLGRLVSRAHRTSEAVTVIFIDLNGFKGINDRLGHEAGDTVLTSIAERLVRVTREGDTVARVGGDEFLICAPHEAGETIQDIRRLVERVLDAVSLPIDLGRPLAGGDSTVVMTASIGVSTCPQDGFEVAGLVRKADVAMYSAKQAGGNSFRIYSERLKDEADLMASMRLELLSGLERGEFVPYYQPIVDASSGRLVGVEVLSRWLHAERGVVQPGDFLELLKTFDQWESFLRLILAQVADDLPSLRAICPSLGISLNVDPSQLRRSDVPALLHEALGELTGVVIEVTEHAEFGDDPEVARILARLRAMGARISLDDFGIGYSSVLHLKAWAFDEVKVDRAFVADLLEGDGDRQLVKTMIAMAHALGARAVVEGIESEAMADVVRGMGADLLQGYLFARPMPAADLAEWMRERG